VTLLSCDIAEKLMSKEETLRPPAGVLLDDEEEDDDDAVVVVGLDVFEELLQAVPISPSVARSDTPPTRVFVFLTDPSS
jgi:hypothetical protein